MRASLQREITSMNFSFSSSSRMGRSTLLALAAAGAFWVGGAVSQPLGPAPEAATGRIAKSVGTAQRYMVAAANPLAAGAGREILRAGGSATDAAIAIQLVLNLVEPQSSGIGG